MIVTSVHDILFHDKKETTEKLACQETESPEMLSQSFLVSWFQLFGFVTH